MNELALIRAEWTQLQLEIANVMQQLTSMAGRASKLEGLLRRRDQAQGHVPPQPGPQAPPINGRLARRLHKARLRASMSGSGSALPAPQPEAETDEPADQSE